jgi:hypothetical protein
VNFIAFGAGEPTWQIGIAINIPLGRNLHSAGQLVESDGNFFIAHRGGLGGGKYSVPADQFAAIIKGFVRSPVEDGEANRELFVLADTAAPDDLGELAAYIKEADRIRTIRRNQTTSKFDKLVAKAVAAEGLSPENDEAGEYSRAARVEFQRRHGQVHSALVARLKSAGFELSNKPLPGGIRPDLIARKKGKAFIFEIKASVGAQVEFTAIGQLLVYGSSVAPTPVKIFVGAQAPSAQLVRGTFEQQGIATVTYGIVGKNVIFSGLEKHLD